MEAASELRERARSELIAAALRAGGEIRLRVMGTCMLPVLWPGDVLKIRPADGSLPALGEIIVFHRHGRFFAHRVVGRLRGSAGAPHLLTGGDFVGGCDPPVEPAALVGSVVAVMRDGRPATAHASKPSEPMRLLALMMRHVDPLRRLILKIHAARRRLREG